MTRQGVHGRGLAGDGGAGRAGGQAAAFVGLVAYHRGRDLWPGGPAGRPLRAVSGRHFVACFGYEGLKLRIPDRGSLPLAVEYMACDFSNVPNRLGTGRAGVGVFSPPSFA